MKNILYVFLLFIGVLHAQTYQWEWAIGGGGEEGASNYFSDLDDEYIRDAVVDDQGNAYFLTSLFGDNPIIANQPINHYGRPIDIDILLFSTDCNGNFRWARPIGSGHPSTFSWTIGIDNNNGLYIMANLYNLRDIGNQGTTLPFHIDDEISLPTINMTWPYGDVTDPGLNMAYLLKYNTDDGHLIWQKPLQGEVSFPLRKCNNAVWTMDSDHNIHALIGYKAGTHLEGLITVPDTYIDTFQFYMVKFNFDNGNMTVEEPPLLLPMTGDLYPALRGGKVQLLYSEDLNRYYLGGCRSYLFGGFSDLSYNDIPFTTDGYMLSFNATTGEEVWRKEFLTYFSDQIANTQNSKIFSLLQDENSDIYISGFYSNQVNPTNIDDTYSPTFGDYTLPMTGEDGINMNYVMKMDAEGNVIWVKIPEVSSTYQGWSGVRTIRPRIALNGDEIAFVKGAIAEIWDDFELFNPQNTKSDPLLVRLDKTTGYTLGMYEIEGSGAIDEMTSVAVDSHGNYIVGGFYFGPFFLDPDDGIPTLTDPSNGWESNFFVAKLAKTDCEGEPLATQENDLVANGTSIYPNPTYDVLFVESKEALQTYEVYNSNGQLVLKGTFSPEQKKILVKALPQGSYFITLVTDKGKTSHKFLKK